MSKLQISLIHADDSTQEGMDDVMEGKVLELTSDKIKAILSEGEAKGEAIGEIKHAKTVYNNCISRGMSPEDATAISGWDDKQKKLI